MNVKKRTLTLLALLAVAAIATLMFAVAALAGKPGWWQDQEHLSDRIAIAAVNAVPYPESQVEHGGFLERKNVKERLVRFSKPNKLGYVYVLSFGKFVGYYTIKGKISSTQSQLTNTTQTWQAGRDDNASMQVSSIGDDGSFGENEQGVFFFTTGGAMVETSADFVYSDVPLAVDVPNLRPKK